MTDLRLATACHYCKGVMRIERPKSQYMLHYWCCDRCYDLDHGLSVYSRQSRHTQNCRLLTEVGEEKDALLLVNMFASMEEE